MVRAKGNSVADATYKLLWRHAAERIKMRLTGMYNRINVHYRQ